MNRRILFCDSLPFWGGGEHWIVRTAGRLQERGWIPVVAARSGSELLRRAGEANLETISWPYSRDFDPATILRARRFLHAHACGCVVLTTGRDIRTVGLTARRQGIPVVWRMGTPPNHSLVHRLTGNWVVSHVIAPSHFVRERLEEFPWLRGKITVIPNGIAPPPVPNPDQVMAARRKLGWPDGARIVLYVGRLLHAKGVDVLLDAFAQIPSAGDIHLACVGTGPEESALKERARAWSLQDRVTFHGFADDPSVFFDACDLLVLPSRAETFGYVLLEAMSRAKPVIATDVGGIPETVGDSARLVPSENPSALAQAISALLADRQTYQLLSEAGQARVRRDFTEDRAIDRIDEFFVRILGNRQPRRQEVRAS